MRSDLLPWVPTLRLSPRAAVLVLAVAALALAAFLMAAKPAQASTFTVTKTADINDDACSANDCSLRDAIIAANNNPGPDTISVPVGGYILYIAGRGEDAAGTGDLDVSDELTITGAGAQSTVIDAKGVGANGIDRVFEDRPNTKLTISGVTIEGGDASGGISGDGSGVLVDSGASLTLNNSIITDNKNADYGGGLLVDSGGAATLNNVTISNNTANFNGGGLYYFSAGNLTVTNSTINNNTAVYSGGGLYNNGGTVTLTNDTFSSNTAGNGPGTGGGGIFSDGNSAGTLKLTNVTINQNKINAGSGGGVFMSNGSATFENSIVANSTGGTDCSAPGGTLTSQGNNLSSDASCNFTASGDIQNQDPKLGPLQDNLGPTQTHALLAGSPAIDAGDNTACPTTDQRGVARPQDGDSNGNAICDIGAFEVAAQGPPPPSPSPPGTNPPPSSGDQPPTFGSQPPSSGGRRKHKHHGHHGGGHHHKGHGHHH